MARREHREAHNLLLEVAGERVEQREVLDLVVEHLDAQRVLGALGREDVDHVTPHPEGAAPEVDVGPVVLHRHQALHQVAVGDTLALAQMQHHRVVIGRITDTVDARHRGHDHHIAPLHQAFGGRQAHLLDVLVDRRILLDEEIARRHVGLGLVVVVVTHEILHRVLGEELAELGIQLGRQRLVVGQHQGRTAAAGDDIGHRVGLARAGDAQQGLEHQAVVDALDELADRLRLVAAGRKRLMEPERAPLENRHAPAT